MTSRPSRPLRHPAFWSLVALAVLWAAVFGTLVWLRHDRFDSFGFDLGIYDQALWLLSRGEEPFVTVRGLHVLGHHVNPAFFLLVPFYLAGAGPHFLNLLQTASLALAPFPIFVLVHHLTGRLWVALGPAAALLVHPTVAALDWELFHPDTMAITPLLGAYLAARRGRWGWYGVLLALAVAWKEDLALAGLMLGVILLFRGHRRAGLITAAACLGWFVLAVSVVIPAFNPAGPFYAATMFGDLGDSPGVVVRTALTRPLLVLERVADQEAGAYLLRLAGPFGLLPPLAGPLALLVGLPQALVNLLTEFPYTRRPDLHYAAVPFAALALATAEGVAALARRRGSLGVPAAALVAGAALAGTALWGPTPTELAAQIENPRRAAMVEAVGLLPDRAAVTASYNLVPHLSHRPLVYEWPNPWRTVNWGVDGEGRHDPGRVRWLAIDLRTVRPEDRSLLERLLADEFLVRYQQDQVVVAERIPEG